VDIYSDGLYRYAFSMMKDEEDASDVVQDCFEKIWKRRSEISFDKAKSYLFTTCHHTIMDYLKRKKRINLHEIEDNRQVFNNHYENKNLKEIIFSFLEQLPDNQKSVLLLRDYEGYSYEEIGKITGLKMEQVKVYIYRARMKMREIIGQWENII
jgi:RNA polymerase sigma-70 factor (ECF subfamily)